MEFQLKNIHFFIKKNFTNKEKKKLKKSPNNHPPSPHQTNGFSPLCVNVYWLFERNIVYIAIIIIYCYYFIIIVILFILLLLFRFQSQALPPLGATQTPRDSRRSTVRALLVASTLAGTFHTGIFHHTCFGPEVCWHDFSHRGGQQWRLSAFVRHTQG